MTDLRPIEEKYSIEKEHWVGSGFRVKNYFPEGKNLLQRFSPFALMDYNAPKEFPPSKSPKGIGPHPHRGIETVTFAFQGSVEHHDNAGNHGIIYPGDVQWMTAGAGIMHKEYHELEFQKTGGIFHMIQLWINLPKKDKLTAPRYQELQKENMGKHKLPSGDGEVTIIAGEYEGIKGPALTFSPINIYLIDLNPGANITLNEPGNYNTGILVISGDMDINNTASKENDFILFENKEGLISINKVSIDTKLIVLSGEPLNEPAVAAGPFVMNTKEELRQAALDYREGRFGTDQF
ncbi:MAG: pirin family protein [Tissierellales bacterium]